MLISFQAVGVVFAGVIADWAGPFVDGFDIRLSVGEVMEKRKAFFAVHTGD
jgi:hypothetical protein